MTTVKIDKVSIVIESIDGENASVRLLTEPVPVEDEEIEETPAVLLGASVWDVVQEFLSNTDLGTFTEGSHTLQ